MFKMPFASLSNDAARFTELRAELSTSFDPPTVANIFRTVAGVLQLGRVEMISKVSVVQCVCVCV
jgi:hypothetical protein